MSTSMILYYPCKANRTVDLYTTAYIVQMEALGKLEIRCTWYSVGSIANVRDPL